MKKRYLIRKGPLFLLFLWVHKTKRMKYLFYILLLISFSQCKPKADNPNTQFYSKPEVPSSIKITHVFLLEQIHKMTLFKDSSGRVALKLESWCNIILKRKELHHQPFARIKINDWIKTNSDYIRYAFFYILDSFDIINCKNSCCQNITEAHKVYSES